MDDGRKQGLEMHGPGSNSAYRDSHELRRQRTGARQGLRLTLPKRETDEGLGAEVITVAGHAASAPTQVLDGGGGRQWPESDPAARQLDRGTAAHGRNSD